MDFQPSQLRVNLVRLEDSKIKNHDFLEENNSKKKNGFKSKKIKINKRKEHSEKYPSKNYKKTNKTSKHKKPYTDAFKLKILQKLKKGASVRKLATLHGVSQSSINSWRKSKKNIESTYKIFGKNISGKHTKIKKSLKANIKSLVVRLRKTDLLKEREKAEIINPSKELINENKKSVFLESASFNTNNVTKNIKTNDSKACSTSFKSKNKEKEISKDSENSHVLLKTPIIRLKRLPKNALSHQEKQKNNVQCKSCKCSCSSDTEISKKNKNYPDIPDMQDDHSQNPNESSTTETIKDTLEEMKTSNHLPQTEHFSNIRENIDQVNEEQNSIPSLNTEVLPNIREPTDNRPAGDFPGNRDTIEDRSAEEINFVSLAQTEDSPDIRDEDKNLRTYRDANHSVPIDYLCRDCGLEWELVCSNIPVDTFINDLDEYRRNIRRGITTKSYRKMYLTMLWLKATNDSDDKKNTETPETLTCVVPYEETNWAWEIKHLDSKSRCQLLPHVSKKSACLSHEVKEDLDWDDEDNWQTICVTESRDTVEEIKEEPVLPMHDQSDDDIKMSEVGEKISEETQIRSTESLNETLEIKEEEEQSIQDLEPLDILVECKEENLNNDSAFQVFDKSNMLNDHTEETELCLETENLFVLNSLLKNDLVTTCSSEKDSTLNSLVNKASVGLISISQTEDIASLRIEECLSENDIYCEEEELIDENLNLDNCNNENSDKNFNDDDSKNYINNCNNNGHNKDYTTNGSQNNSEKQSENLVVNVSYANDKSTVSNKGGRYDQVGISENGIILEQISVARTNEASNILQAREILVQDIAPDTHAEVILTPLQVSVLSTQILQHRQLLLTSALLCYNNPPAQYIQQGCQQYLEEVNELTEGAETIKMMDNHVGCMDETLKTFKALKHLQENKKETQKNRNNFSCSIKENWSKKKTEKGNWFKKKTKKVNLHTDIKAIILQSSAFPYPCLLPTCMFTQHVGKSVFLASEDNLLALGMEKYSYRDIELNNRNKKKAEALEKIRREFLPGRQLDQLHSRIKNLMTRFKDNDQHPVLHYLSTGNLIVPAAEYNKVSPFVPCPVSQFPCNMLPELWRQESLQLNLQKKLSTWPSISEDCSRQKIISPKSVQSNTIPILSSCASRGYVYILPQPTKMPLLVSSNSLLDCQSTSNEKSTWNVETERLNNDSSNRIPKNLFEDESSEINMISEQNRADCLSMNNVTFANITTDNSEHQVQTDAGSEMIQGQNSDENGLHSSENVFKINLNYNEINNAESLELNTICKSKPNDITCSVAMNNSIKNVVIEDEISLMGEPIKQLGQMENLLNRDKSYETTPKSILENLLNRDKSYETTPKSIFVFGTASSSLSGGNSKKISSSASTLDLNTSLNNTQSHNGYTILNDISKDFLIRDNVSQGISEDNIDVKDEIINDYIDLNELDFAISYNYSDTESIINPCEETKPNCLSLETQCSLPQTQINSKNGTSTSDAFVRVPVSALKHVNSSNLQRRFIPIEPKHNIVENDTLNVATTAVTDTSVDSIMRFSTMKNVVMKQLFNETNVHNKTLYNRKKTINPHKPGYHNKEERNLPSNERKPRKIKNPNRMALKLKKLCNDSFSITPKKVINKLQETEIQSVKGSELENTSITSEIPMVPINTISQQYISEISSVPTQTEYQHSTQNKCNISYESGDFIRFSVPNSSVEALTPKTETFDYETISPKVCKSTTLMTIKMPILSIINPLTSGDSKEKNQESSTEIGQNSANCNISMGESFDSIITNDDSDESNINDSGAKSIKRTPMKEPSGVVARYRVNLNTESVDDRNQSDEDVVNFKRGPGGSPNVIVSDDESEESDVNSSGAKIFQRTQMKASSGPMTSKKICNGINMLENNPSKQSELESNAEVLSIKEEVSESPMTTNLSNNNLISVVKFTVPLSSATKVRTSDVSSKIQNKNNSSKDDHLAIINKVSEKKVQNLNEKCKFLKNNTFQGTNNSDIEFINNSNTNNGNHNKNDNSNNSINDDKSKNIDMTKYNSHNIDISNNNNDANKKISLREKNVSTVCESQPHNQLQTDKEKANESLVCSALHNYNISQTKSAIPISPVTVPKSSFTLLISPVTDPRTVSIVSHPPSSVAILPNTSTPYTITPYTSTPYTSTPYVSNEGKNRLSMSSIDTISPVSRYPAKSVSLNCETAESATDSHYLPKSIYSALLNVSKDNQAQNKRKLYEAWSKRKKYYSKEIRKDIARNAVKDSDEHANTASKSVIMDQQPNDCSIASGEVLKTNLDNSLFFATVNNDLQTTSKEKVSSRTNSFTFYSEKNISKDILNEIPNTNEGGPGSGSFVNNDTVNENISIFSSTCLSSSNPCVSPKVLCSASSNGPDILDESKDNQAQNKQRVTENWSKMKNNHHKILKNVDARNAIKDSVEKTNTVSKSVSMDQQLIDSAISYTNDEVLKTKITSKDKFKSSSEKNISKSIANEILNTSEGNTGSSSFVNNNIENVSISRSLCSFSANPRVSPRALNSTSHNSPGSSKVFFTSSSSEPSVLSRALCSSSPNSSASTLNTPDSHTFTENSFSATQPNYDNVSFFSRVDKLQKLENRMLGKESERIFKFRRYSKGKGRREINFSKSGILDLRPRRKITLSSSSLTDASANISELFLTDKASAISVPFSSEEAEEQQQSRKIIGLEQEQNMKITDLEKQENNKITETSSRKMPLMDEYVPKSSTNENEIDNINCSAQSSTDTSKRNKLHCDSYKLTYSTEKERHSRDSLNQHNIIVLPKKLCDEKQAAMPRKYRLIKPKPVATLVKTVEITENKVNHLLPCSKNISSSPNTKVELSNRLGKHIIKSEEKNVAKSHRKLSLDLKTWNAEEMTIVKERNQTNKTSLKYDNIMLSGKPLQTKRTLDLENMRKNSKRSKCIRNNISIEEIAQITDVDVNRQSKSRNKRIRKKLSEETAQSTKVYVGNRSNSSSGAGSNSTESLNSKTKDLAGQDSFITDPESCIISWLKDNYEQRSDNYLIQDQVYRHFVKAMHKMEKISGFNGNGLSLMDPILVTSCVLKVFDKVHIEDIAADRWGIYNGLAKCKIIRGEKRKS